MLLLKKIFKEKNIYLFFEVSVILKGINAILEIIGGIGVLFVTKGFLINFVSSITHEELTEDPKDFISHYLLKSAQHFSISGQWFISFYLLSHGIIKIFLVIGLLRKKLWAYPASIFVFSLFIIYQVYRYAYTHSPWLMLLTLFDLVVLSLVWHEYHFIKGNIKPEQY